MPEGLGKTEKTADWVNIAREEDLSSPGVNSARSSKKRFSVERGRIGHRGILPTRCLAPGGPF